MWKNHVKLQSIQISANIKGILVFCNCPSMAVSGKKIQTN